jgi:hypothetical protein
LNEYQSIGELITDVGDYIEFYNHRRFHETLAYKKPTIVCAIGVYRVNAIGAVQSLSLTAQVVAQWYWSTPPFNQ